MVFNQVRSLPRVTAACAGLLLFLSACGSDLTGPGNLDAISALRSLELGLGSVVGAQSPVATSEDGLFSAIGPFLGRVDVTIDGKAQTMFALGLRETFPAGTCMENIFIFPSIPPDNSVCTPMGPEVAVILWQSHSAFTPPDRLIFIAADAGTSDFDFMTAITSGDDVVPAFALYMEGQDDVWDSLSGTLTSQIAATNESCGLPLPPYAKAGSCSLANFDEQGSITFEQLSETASDKRLNVTIPRQSFHGLWQMITETQQITVPLAQRTFRWLGQWPATQNFPLGR
jgi:hypothetical protein